MKMWECMPEEVRQTLRTLGWADPDEVRALKDALEKIASGMSGDLLGTTSLSKDDMQHIARAAIAKAQRLNKKRRTP